MVLHACLKEVGATSVVRGGEWRWPPGPFPPHTHAAWALPLPPPMQRGLCCGLHALPLHATCAPLPPLHCGLHCGTLPPLPRHILWDTPPPPRPLMQHGLRNANRPPTHPPTHSGYKHFGLNRGSHEGKPGIWYREWAPAAKAVSLVGEFNNWQVWEGEEEGGGPYSGLQGL